MRADRVGAHRAARRSDPRHLRILPDARAHHPRADRQEGLSLRGDRGGLAGCRPRRPLCAAFPVSAVGVDRLCAVSDLDVAKHRGARFRQLAAQAQRHGGDRTSASRFTASISTASTIRSGRSWTISTRSIRNRRRVARERYGCLTPWQRDPATYGHAALTGSYPTCEADVARTLADLLAKRRAYAEHDGERFLDAEQNARLVANAERYYRIMYYGSRASWNLRDSHMFETLKNLLAFHGADSKAVVWAHNSHVGNAGGDRDGGPRRVQYRPALPRGVRRAGLSDRLRHQQRHGRRGVRMGRPDGGQEGPAGASRQL